MRSICCRAPPAHPCSSWRQPSWPCASSTAKPAFARLQLARKADEAPRADCQSPWQLGCLLAWISLLAHEAHLTFSQPPQCPAWSMGYPVTPACPHSFNFTFFLHSASPPHPSHSEPSWPQSRMGAIFPSAAPVPRTWRPGGPTAKMALGVRRPGGRAAPQWRELFGGRLHKQLKRESELIKDT